MLYTTVTPAEKRERFRELLAAPEIARIMGDVLGWDEAERARQVDLYEQMRRAEPAALQENDEDTAQRLREGAGNPYPQQRG